jgi:lipopolysaccharide exporter
MVTLGIYDKAFSTVNRFLTRLNAGGPGVTFRIFAIIQEQPERFVGAYRKVVLSTSLLALPIFTVLMVVAPQFMVFLFGARWRPAALPFQILCLSGYLKLLNTYASSATQAAGYIWSEVWRQVLYVTLIVASLVLLRGYGAPGAAAGVLAATALMTILMHWLLLRVTSLTPWGLASAIGPGAACALTAGGGVWLLQVALARWAPVPDVVLLLGQAVLATVLFVGFVLFAPLRELRALVVDVYTDLAPGFVKRRAWVGRMIGVGPAGAVVAGGTGR